MNNWFNNLVIFNGYPLSIVVAVTMHILLLAAMLYLQSADRTEVLELVQPTVIKALFIDENPQVRNQRIIERQRIERQEQQRLERAAEQRRQQEAAQRQAEAEQQRQQEQEQQRERAALLERQQLERQRAEQLLQDQKQRETEQQRQQERASAERQRQQAEAERQRQQQAANEAAALEAARTEYELVQSATALIQQVVQENWSRPPSARNGMRAILQIRMLPTGELLDATITQSSGDPAFDRSAETAVFRAAPFTELKDLPITIFNANFRSLSLIFEPQDLLN
jgi:colicin import membrane protein